MSTTAIGALRSSPIVGNAMISDGEDGWSIVHKFGRNDAVPTTVVPLCLGGMYPMPQVGDATPLRIKAGGHVNDDAAGGSGAREITLHVLDTDGEFQQITLDTNGADASLNTPIDVLRLFRMKVTASGTYATIPNNTQAALITIENAAGTQDWGIINTAMGQSHIGAYTVPLNKIAYINSWLLTADSNKKHDLLIYARENILETVTPYTGMLNKMHLIGLVDNLEPDFKVPLGPFPALTDIVFAGKVAATTGSLAIDFEILLKDV